MGRKLPWNDIPKPSQDMPKGAFLFEIESIEEGNFEGRFTINALYRCVEPEDMRGKPHYQTYYIGTDEDPNADDPVTMMKSRDMQNFKEHLAQAGVKGSEDFAKLASNAIGKRVGFVFREYTGKATLQDGRPNPRAGEVRTRVAKAFMAGEIPLGEGDVGRAPKPKAAVQAKPAAPVKPARAAEPDDDEDEPAPPPKKAGRKPADYDEDDDD